MITKGVITDYTKKPVDGESVYAQILEEELLFIYRQQEKLRNTSEEYKKLSAKANQLILEIQAARGLLF